MGEKVLCVSRNIARRIFRNEYSSLLTGKGGYQNNLSEKCKNGILKLLLENSKLMDRNIVENDSKILQLIPYFSICYLSDDLCNLHIVTYERTNQSSENRLQGLKSIGFGGHINEEDICLNEDTNKPDKVSILNCISREFNEELECKSNFEFEQISNIIGFIVDNTSDVGKVHLGIFYTIDKNINDIQLKENKLSNLSSIYVEEDSEKINLDEFEIWSQLLLKEVIKNASKSNRN